MRHAKPLSPGEGRGPVVQIQILNLNHRLLPCHGRVTSKKLAEHSSCTSKFFSYRISNAISNESEVSGVWSKQEKVLYHDLTN